MSFSNSRLDGEPQISIAATTELGDPQASSSSSYLSSHAFSSSILEEEKTVLLEEKDAVEKEITSIPEEPVVDEDKTSRSSDQTNRVSFFPSLGQLAFAQLSKKLGGIQQAKKYLSEQKIDVDLNSQPRLVVGKQERNPNADSFRKLELSRILPPKREGIKLDLGFMQTELTDLPLFLRPLAKKLLNHAIRGEREEIATALNANLRYLSPLLKVSGRVTAYARGFEKDHKVELEGTMFRLATGAGDVSYVDENPEAKEINVRDERCGFRVMTKAPTDIKDLPKRKNCAYVLVQPVRGAPPTELYFIDKRETKPENKVKRVSFFADKNVSTLAATLFPSAANNHMGYTDIDELTPMQLTQITLHTGHTHEEGIRDMLKRYYRMLPDGELEIELQDDKQFPEGYAELEKKQNAADLVAIKKIFKAVADAKSQDEAGIMRECKDAFDEFRKHVKLKFKGVITTGFHSSLKMEDIAWGVYDDNYAGFGGYNSPRNRLVSQKVIGYIQRFLSACDGQAHAQGIYDIVENGEKLNRSLEYRYDRGAVVFPLDLDPVWVLGENCFASARGRPVVRASLLAVGRGFGKFLSSKNIAQADLYAASRQSVEDPLRDNVERRTSP